MMTPVDDHSLLRRYAEDNFEAALAQWVRRPVATFLTPLPARRFL